ncbi:hypothetical protein DIPPA_04169 [Diplonema papillatum]|nr:hypothetical protein DIPPA_04169 [Diplonema papillatum]
MAAAACPVTVGRWTWCVGPSKRQPLCVLTTVASLLTEEYEWTGNPRDPAEYNHGSAACPGLFVHHALFLPPLTAND